MKQKEEELVREVEQLKLKISEIERLAKGRGLSGILNFRHAHALEGVKSSEWLEKIPVLALNRVLMLPLER